MKRLGKFTWTLYPDDYDFSKCPECCICIGDHDAENEEYLNELKTRYMFSCRMCMQCPEAKNFK